MLRTEDKPETCSPTARSLDAPGKLLVSRHWPPLTLRPEGPAGVVASERRFFWNGVAALGGVAAAVIALALWLVPEAGLRVAAPEGVAFGPWALQVLVTGNLAVGLVWVWLDTFAQRHGSSISADRENLQGVALIIAIGITLFSLALGGNHCGNEVLAMGVCVASPTLAVTLPLLWLTARRIEPIRLRTLILIGFIAASSLAQSRAGDRLAAGDELAFFVANSCLIGLAVAVWLVTCNQR